MLEPQDIKSILVINLGGVGDLLLSTPALRAIKGHFTGAQLYLLAAARVCSSARGLSYVDRVFAFDPEHPWRHMAANLSALMRLRSLRVDLAVNMRTMVSDSSAAKMRWIMDTIGPRYTAGRDTARRGSFLDIKVHEDDIGEKYEMDYDIETVRALGCAVEDREIDLPVDPDSAAFVSSILKDAGIGDSETIIGIHPGGKPSHRWPADHFVEVVKRLHEEFGCAVLITGSKDEARLARYIMDKSAVKAVNLAGKLSIRALAAVVKRCNVYITNDTGSMHVAAIMKTPLVALFGPGYLARYDPRNISSRSIVLYKRETCAPCNRVSCASQQCLKAITVAEVVGSARELLAKGGR